MMSVKFLYSPISEEHLLGQAGNISGQRFFFFFFLQMLAITEAKPGPSFELALQCETSINYSY